MKTLIAIPVMGQFEIGRISLHCFDQLTSDSSEFLLIDNTPDPTPWARFALDRSQRWFYIWNKNNIGLIKSIQQAYEYADRYEYDILILTHNDVWIYNWSWDYHIKFAFEEVEKLGGVGLFGSKGCGREGHRLDTFGSLVEMSGHGRSLTCVEGDWEPAVTFDGFFMAYSMEMLRKVGGFDQRYVNHHIYDLDASLTSIDLGYKNIVMNIPCHHLSGLTANNDAKNTCGPDVHQHNSKLFLEKWKGKLGVTVDEDFNYRWGL